MKSLLCDNCAFEAYTEDCGDPINLAGDFLKEPEGNCKHVWTFVRPIWNQKDWAQLNAQLRLIPVSGLLLPEQHDVALL